jgi:hypothetical protein
MSALDEMKAELDALKIASLRRDARDALVKLGMQDEKRIELATRCLVAEGRLAHVGGASLFVADGVAGDLAAGLKSWVQSDDGRIFTGAPAPTNGRQPNMLERVRARDEAELGDGESILNMLDNIRL